MRLGSSYTRYYSSMTFSYGSWYFMSLSQMCLSVFRLSHCFIKFHYLMPPQFRFCISVFESMYIYFFGSSVYNAYCILSTSGFKICIVVVHIHCLMWNICYVFVWICSETTLYMFIIIILSTMTNIQRSCCVIWPSTHL